MTTETKPAVPVRSRRAPKRRLAAALVALTVAGSAASYTASSAQADPATELITVAGQVIRELDLPPEIAALVGQLPNIFTLLIPGYQPPEAPSSPDTGERRTSCTSVVHIGDSTSVGIDDASRFNDPADRLSAQYERIGVQTVTLNADGARSIVEKHEGRPNAVEAIESEKAAGKDGCWVIAMGVNDAANIGVGSTVNADQRIDRVMAELPGRKVLWPTVATHDATVTGYSEANMKTFNDALRRAAARYPNLHVYDFAAEVQPGWFTDGIHYNTIGLAQRNRLFATGLATAFPR
ncbi:MAG: SGNH/GDSL hydrolase family protein [Gordonia sp. (in: high G+C Gram-positive bacteria)]|uniref:SGNH/GDSL hydrolase family protein n=1 Tax=Gordonia sp. (in: high G+C Gram-positive bacteria) TaxID=84139 RepID=UPI0039E5F3A7